MARLRPCPNSTKATPSAQPQAQAEQERETTRMNSTSGSCNEIRSGYLLKTSLRAEATMVITSVINSAGTFSSFNVAVRSSATALK